MSLGSWESTYSRYRRRVWWHSRSPGEESLRSRSFVSFRRLFRSSSIPARNKRPVYRNTAYLICYSLSKICRLAPSPGEGGPVFSLSRCQLRAHSSRNVPCSPITVAKASHLSLLPALRAELAALWDERVQCALPLGAPSNGDLLPQLRIRWYLGRSFFPCCGTSRSQDPQIGRASCRERVS